MADSERQKKNKGLEFIHVELKRDSWVNPELTVETPQDAVQAVQKLIQDMDREMAVCINLSTSGQVINASICSIGTVDSALISPPEILRGAMLSGASRFIFLHNHPSGNPKASKEDLLVTKRLATVGEWLGVKLLDSIIIGRDGRRFSMQEEYPQVLEPQMVSAELPVVAESEVKERQPVSKSSQTALSEGRREVNYITENRRAVVDQVIDLIESGQSFYSPQWSKAAMRPRNPISGAIYHGANRLVLMKEAIRKDYRDPRWMTFKQLTEKGYQVKKGARATRLEKWIFTERKMVKDEDGKPVRNPEGHIIYEERLLEKPKCNLFSVFNGEQIVDFPEYEEPFLPVDEIGRRIEALLVSSEAEVHMLAQDRSFYSPTTDNIYLPLRSAFRDEYAFAEVLAHEMIHSTGHETRLNRQFGYRDPLGRPDRKYCLEELKAELGSVFVMNDLGIPITPCQMEGAAAYMEGYLKALRENPNLLFQVASDAEKASVYLRKSFCKQYEWTDTVEILPERPRRKEFGRKLEEKVAFVV